MGGEVGSRGSAGATYRAAAVNLGVRAGMGGRRDRAGDRGRALREEEDGPGERARAGSESDGARGLRERGADKRGPVGRGGALAWLLGDAGRLL